MILREHTGSKIKTKKQKQMKFSEKGTKDIWPRKWGGGGSKKKYPLPVYFSRFENLQMILLEKVQFRGTSQILPKSSKINKICWFL
jgi:hypothetical protein